MNTFDISVQRFDEFASQYAERFMVIESYLPSIDRFCDAVVAPSPRILELACGPGNVTRHIRQRFPGSQYIAIDLAPKMIDIARQQVSGVDFRVMDVREISTLDETFDAIVCSFCLPFLSKSDTRALIADCASRLTGNGVIYISTMEGDESEAGFEPTSFSGHSEIYFNYHQQKDLEHALLTNGFIIDNLKRQDYQEPDGSTSTDMIIIGIKKTPRENDGDSKIRR